MGTDYVDTGASGTKLVYIEIDPIQLSYAVHPSLNRCPPFSPTTTEMICSPCHRGLLIYKIYNID